MPELERHYGVRCHPYGIRQCWGVERLKEFT